MKRNFKKESKTVKVSSPCHPHPRQRMYKSCLVQRRSRGWEGRWCTSGGGIQEVWTFWNWKIGEKRKRKMSVSFVNLLSGHLPGYSPANMVGYGGVSVVPPCWTNLGKEHSVLWLVALDCRDEPEQAEFESSPTSWQISRCKLVSSYYHSKTETVTNHFFIVTRADPKQELEQELVAVSSSFDAGSEEPACLLIIVISLIIVI